VSRKTASTGLDVENVSAERIVEVLTKDMVAEHTLAESWRAVVGYEGYYEVSDRGRVRSLERSFFDSIGRPRRFPGIEMSTPIGSGGYPSVYLKRSGSVLSTAVHRLVADAFLGAKEAGQEVCHKNGNKFDPRASNLRWGSRSSNILDEVKHGTHVNARKTHCPQGHEYAGENLIRRRNSRECRACIRARSARKNGSS